MQKKKNGKLKWDFPSKKVFLGAANNYDFRTKKNRQYIFN